MSEDIIDHDAWPYAPPKSPKASAITLDRITGVLPFDGKRNPGFRSATSHRVWLTYKTPANDWQPKVAICESGAEAAVVYEAFLQEDLYDIRFQPFSVSYEFEGRTRNYTHDLLVTFVNGHRRLIFVRNGRSLSRVRTYNSA